MTVVIGITGGIASGKSTIARMIAQRGILHLDADKEVHRLLSYDRETIAEIESLFPGTTGPVGVDRKKLGAAIAGDEIKLKRLEQVLHPRVRAAEEEAILRAQHQRRRAILLDIPLLFETGAETLCDVVIVAHAPLALRRRRALARNHMTESTFNRLVARQLSEAERMKRGDVVIPTTIGKAHTRRKVDALLKQWGLT
jgi:dephospho-CoA kinase